jgi:hypothetical protein
MERLRPLSAPHFFVSDGFIFSFHFPMTSVLARPEIFATFPREAVRIRFADAEVQGLRPCPPEA